MNPYSQPVYKGYNLYSSILYNLSKSRGNINYKKVPLIAKKTVIRVILKAGILITL